jgi:hypothetical protein
MAHTVVRGRGSHIFYTIGSQMAVRLSALHAGRVLPPRATAGRIRSIEKIHLIRTQSRDLPACSIVPQPATLLCAPIQWVTGAFSLGVKHMGREADHSSPLSDEVKNAWHYNSFSHTSSWCGTYLSTRAALPSLLPEMFLLSMK